MSRLSFFVDSFPEQHKQGPGIYFLIFLSSFLQFLFLWPLFSLDSPSALFDVLLLHQVVAYVIAFSTEEKNFCAEVNTQLCLKHQSISIFVGGMK